MKIFEPLSAYVWLVIFFVIFSQGWLDLLYFEEHTEDADAAFKARGMSSRTRAGRLAFQSVWTSGVKWLAFMGHDEGFPTTMGSLINAAGFNFFIFIVTTAYTVRACRPGSLRPSWGSNRVRAGARACVRA